MEYEFSINTLFPDAISSITRDTLHGGKAGHHKSKHQKNLEVVIDELGRKSAQAQNLSAPITYLQKSLFNEHHLYVLKDSEANNGLGSIVGFIKVGKKRLFLIDHQGNQNEIYPLCVLDFYVHESHQRKGCGLQLFNHMLQTECVKAIHLAIDRPSFKFLSFLKKHFKISQVIPQVNNFVIFDGFFENRSDILRTNVVNEKFGNSHFRPLSRAVSDDVIRRHREVEVAQHYRNNPRPISGFTISQDEDYANYHQTRNNRRKRWNADGTLSSLNNRSAPTRPNFYSRFAHERHPSPVIKPPLAPVENINHHVSVERINKGMSGEPAEGAEIVDESPASGFPNAKVRPTSESEGSRKVAHLEVRNIDHKFNKPDILVKKQTHTSPYKKPSDMLQELRVKDEKHLREAVTTSPFRHQKRWTHQNGRTSWNIFGVPTANYWTLK